MQGFLMFFAWGSLAAGVILAVTSAAPVISGDAPFRAVTALIAIAWVLGGFFWFVLCKAIADVLDELHVIRSRLR